MNRFVLERCSEKPRWQRCLKRWQGLLAVAALVLLPSTQAVACSISASDFAFGIYDPMSASPTVTSAEVTVTCPGRRTVSVAIGPSRTTGSVTDRRMRHVSQDDSLSYGLYRDSALSLLWGDGVQGGMEVMQVVDRATRRVYAQIPARQDPWVGNYTDSVLIMVLP